MGMPQQVFEFGECQLDRIEIGAVGRQEQQVRAGASDETRRLIALMARQIVEDHRVALVQLGEEDAFDIRQETFAVDRPVQHKGRNQRLAGEARKKRRSQLGDLPARTV